MKLLQMIQAAIMLPPQLKDDGDFANNFYCDTAKKSELLVLIIVGDLDIAVGSTAEDAAPFLEECETVGGAYTAVTGAALSAVIGATDDNKLFAIHMDLVDNTHKRYIRVNAPHSGDGATGGNLCIVGILSKPVGNGPVNAAGQGLEELIKA